MPLYDFKCSCGEKQEKFYSMSAVPSTVECECGNGAIRIYQPVMLNMKSWRGRLSDQPGEIEALEAGMYE